MADKALKRKNDNGSRKIEKSRLYSDEMCIRDRPTASAGGRSAQFSGGGGYTAVGKLKDTAMPLLEAVLK